MVAVAATLFMVWLFWPTKAYGCCYYQMEDDGSS